MVGGKLEGVAAVTLDGRLCAVIKEACGRVDSGIAPVREVKDDAKDDAEDDNPVSTEEDCVGRANEMGGAVVKAAGAREFKSADDDDLEVARADPHRFFGLVLSPIGTDERSG